MAILRKNRIVVVLIAAGVCLAAGLAYWYGRHRASPEPAGSRFVTYKDPLLTPGETEVFKKKIADYKQQLSTTTDKNNRFGLLMRLGFQYYGLGEYAQARDQYLEASKLLPGNPTPYAELYVVENAMTDFASARAHLLKALEFNPTSSQYWRWRFELEQEQFKVTAAQLDALYREALEKTRENVDIVTLYAKFLEERQGDLPGAVSQWKKAIERNPEQRAVYEGEIVRIQNKLK